MWGYHKSDDKGGAFLGLRPRGDCRSRRDCRSCADGEGLAASLWRMWRWRWTERDRDPRRDRGH